MRLLLLMAFACILAGLQDVHPAFSERVEERKQMARAVASYSPYQPVDDPDVLAALGRVPRHAFVPEELQYRAYENRPLPIGYQQTISQPFIVAHMTQILKLERGMKVLEIGTGSGYQAAMLGELCDSVYSMEIIPQLGERAADVLRELGYIQVRVRVGNGYEGWPEEAPFDRMIVTCAPDDIPPALVEQLVPGGRMVIPVGKPGQTQNLVLLRKTRDGQVKIKKQYAVRFVPMTGR